MRFWLAVIGVDKSWYNIVVSHVRPFGRVISTLHAPSAGPLGARARLILESKPTAILAPPRPMQLTHITIHLQSAAATLAVDGGTTAWALCELELAPTRATGLCVELVGW